MTENWITAMKTVNDGHV